MQFGAASRDNQLQKAIAIHKIEWTWRRKVRNSAREQEQWQDFL